MSWADIKASMKRDVHTTFKLSAVYRAAGSETDVAIAARLHTSQAIIGDLDREGFAQVVQDINRVVFDMAELDTLGITLNRLDRVTFADGRAYDLDVMLETGNLDFQTWQVTPA
jgi:hypothetical protein